MFTKQNLKGQTLIETLAAIFILTMGVTAGVGLANYALGTSTSITKQVIATGLAREGVEAIKNMRDTNWLQAGAIQTSCYDFAKPASNDGSCYKNWLTQNSYGAVIYTSAISSTLNPPSNPTNYIVTFWGGDVISPSFPPFWLAPYSSWAFYQTNNVSAVNTICPNHENGANLSYALNFNGNPMTSQAFGGGYYTPTCKPVGSSGFYRKIILQTVTTSPFDKSDSNNDMAELVVKSQVWWSDGKRCAPSSDWPGAGKCSVELDTYLTNWKTY